MYVNGPSAGLQSETEIVLVDSGSTDDTVSIAEDRSEDCTYTQGRFFIWEVVKFRMSSNNGDILVLLSAHCIPLSPTWLRTYYPITENLVIILMVNRCQELELVNFLRVWFLINTIRAYRKFRNEIFLNNANSAPALCLGKIPIR